MRVEHHKGKAEASVAVTNLSRKSLAQHLRRAAAYSARPRRSCTICSIRLKGRVSRQTCSDRCRQVRCRGAAFQRSIRLTGTIVPVSGLALGRSEVRPISIRDAASIITQFEPMTAQVTYAFGLFIDGVLGGAVCFGREYSENLNVWNRYGFTGRMLCLKRGACLLWTPKGSASRLIRRAMRLLPAHIEIVTATLDPHLGETGVVYRAAGFDYAEMAKPGGRYRAGGFSSRELRRRGLKSKSDILAAGLKPRYEHRKGRVFAFRGSAGRRHRAAIEHLIQPYPTRLVNRPCHAR